MILAPASKNCCASCHFLMSRVPELGDHVFLVPMEGRERLLAGEVNPRGGGHHHEYVYACYQKVWDAANLGEDFVDDVPTLLTLDRGESCFFFPYTPGMFFPAAAELERRIADRREAQLDRHVARWSIIIGFVGAVVGAAITVLLSWLGS